MAMKKCKACFFPVDAAGETMSGKESHDRASNAFFDEKHLGEARGVSLIELIIVLGIMSIVMAMLAATYSVQSQATIKAYRLTESDMELQISKSVIERDVAMAGFGLAIKDYCGKGVLPITDATCDSQLRCATLDYCVPVAVSASDGLPDSLSLRGTALGRSARASQAWSYVTSTKALALWPDSRERIKEADRIIYINPMTNTFMTASAAVATGRTWLFPYEPLQDYGTTTPPQDIVDITGAIVYGLYSNPNLAGPESANFPFYTVRYYLGGTAPSLCAPGTTNLLRAESRTDATGGTGDPILNCVLDFQVAFGINADKSDDGNMDCWDNGGVITRGFTVEEVNEHLKQIKVFVLVQQGARDDSYTGPATIRVGDSLLNACGGGGVGRTVTLDAPLRKYRWNVVALSIAPRNM